MVDHTEFAATLVAYLTGRTPQNDFRDWLSRQCPGIDGKTLDLFDAVISVTVQHPMIHLARAQHG